MRKTNTMKRFIKNLLLIMIITIVGITGKMGVQASETTSDYAGEEMEMNFLYLKEAANIYAEKSETSEELYQLTTEDMVLLQEVEGDWTKVLYMGETGYIKTNLLQMNNPDLVGEMDLNQEIEKGAMNVIDSEVLADIMEEHDEIANERFKQEDATKKSKSYMVVIGVLIVAIIGVGVYGVIKNKGSENDEQKSEEKKEEAN